MTDCPPSRIVVTGANGAGKTWLARRIAETLHLPALHKDGLALTRDWLQRPKAEVQCELAGLLSEDRWALDTGPSGLTRDTLSRADLVIWLDAPVWQRFVRVLWRSLRYLGRTRPEHPPGNRDWPGPRQLRFLLGTVSSAASFDTAIHTALAASDIPVLRLRDRASVSRVLGAFQAPGKRAERLE